MPASGNGNAAGVTRLVTSNSRMCKIGMPYLASVLVSSFHAQAGRVYLRPIGARHHTKGVSRVSGIDCLPGGAASAARANGGLEGSHSDIIPEQTGRLHQFH